MGQYSKRKLVRGAYVNPSTYVLTAEEDGTEFMVIREGESFTIDNQLRQWWPVRVPRKSGKGTILMCQKYGDKGNVIKEFPLVHNKLGLWALSSGAARNGVFHTYRAPQTPLEELFDSVGLTRKKIHRVEQIEETFSVTNHYCCDYDGKREYLYGDYEYQKVTGGTYVVYYWLDFSLGYARWGGISEVYITPDADERKVIEKINSLK